MLQSFPLVRLAALDLDGTLLNREGHVTPRTRAALQAAVDKGVYIVPATGPGSGQRNAAGIGAGVSVRENAQVGVVALADGKGFAGSLHRHQAVQQADRGAGAVLFCVGIAAVHCAHGVRWATARTTAPCCKRPGWPL